MAQWIIDAEGFKRILKTTDVEIEIHNTYVKVILKHPRNAVVLIPMSKLNQLIYLEDEGHGYNY